MTIIRWHNRPMLSHFLDNFNEKRFNTGFEKNCGCIPATNILEDEDKFEIQLAAPGLDKKDLKLEMEKEMLSVSFEKKEEKERQQEEEYLRREFEMEGFTRSFTLPDTADAEKIKARYENGILYISIPRLNPEKARLSKSIAVN